MKVSELIKELQKYPEDAEVFIENYWNDFGLTFLEEPGLEFKEEINYSIDKDNQKKYYANYLKHDGVLKNVLIIN